jgi:two-component system CheB/CheR fusion protein
VDGEARVIADGRGAVAQVVCLFRDTTDRQRLKQSLQEQAAALQEADRRKDEFLAKHGHELRNPLAPIRNALNTLRLRGDERRGAARAAFAILERQITHIDRLVEDLLDVSRIAQGKLVLRKQLVEVATVVGQAVECSRPRLEARQHGFVVHLPDRPAWIEADATRIAQVLLNLLNNAAKYTPEGGDVWLTVEAADDEVLFRVRDTGSGIPSEMLSKVFDLFTQLERDRCEGGLGIGLTLVRRLTEMHGGRVEARSDGPGKGSEFIVRLPAAKEVSPAAVPAREALPPGREVVRRRLLVVDDNVDAAHSLALVLELLGHEARTVAVGHAALDALATDPPDAVLLDIDMPGMDGYEVARRVRASPTLQDITLIAVTGHVRPAAHSHWLEAGFDHHLPKPVDLPVLQELLASLGGHERASR